ncbi:MAG TPA: hypothetical protein VGN98_02800 [Tianweitania sediminis]|jgi:hypothetical protein|nr:hypothetical protein [Tianweitania sediminis]
MSATITSHQRARIELAIENLLAILDGLDGDENLEDGHDAEPSLGWSGHGNAHGSYADTEAMIDLEEEETDYDLAGACSDLEFCYGDYDGPGTIEGGQGL